ncbi:MAG: nicotinate-nicotinamide nucleotide adenylyltransferase [Deltaproteobacteria bacterium]|nr:nicotinate-nicotinamide nucleotide adenylyltransferase [Deltaproteobacteria bacterium]
MKKNRIAIYGGAFDPPHIGHVATCDWILRENLADQIWVIPCFLHPFGKPLSRFEDRLSMCEAAFPSKKIVVSHVEQELGGVSYTLRTLQHLQATHPNIEFSLILGEDNKDKASIWKHFDTIQKLASIIWIPRGTHSSIPNVSSSVVRQAVKRRWPFASMIPRAVAEHIIRFGLYR